MGEQDPHDEFRLDPEVTGGVVCYGVPIGEEHFVHAMLAEKAQGVIAGIRNAVRILGGQHRQALWQVLRLSHAARLDYWLQLSYPSDVWEYAE